MIAEDDKVKAKVHALFTIEDGQLTSCDELTYLLEGSKEDENLGSRH